MTEIFGSGGQPVVMSGEYECSECGFRQHFQAGATFPPDHHPEKPWLLYVADGDQGGG